MTIGHESIQINQMQVNLTPHASKLLYTYSQLIRSKWVRENPLSVLIIDKKVTIGKFYYSETLSIAFPDPENLTLPAIPIKNATAFAFKNFATFQLYWRAAYFFVNKNFENFIKKGRIIII